MVAKRNYGGPDGEYARYHSSKKQKQNRAARNKVRRQALRDGIVSKGDNNDIHHKDGNPRNSDPSNLAVQNKSHNRSFARTKTARKKTQSA